MPAGDRASGRTLECHLCHRIGTRGFVPWGSEGWECSNDRACSRRRASGGAEGTKKHTPRLRPCATCPYRRSVPSGIWDATEYAKLREYDGETYEQTAVASFLCHQDDGAVCSGWLGHRDPTELLAVRLGLSMGFLDPSCADYTTDVPLFSSGAEAAAHGLADYETPPEEAVRAIDKLTRTRGLHS